MIIKYNQAIHRPSFNFTMAAILMLSYEILIRLTNPSFGPKVVNGVDAFFQTMLSMIPYGTTFVAIALTLAGLYFYYLDRADGFELDLTTLFFMFAESFIWALLIFIVLPSFIGHLFLNQVGHQGSYIQNIALSLGAGFYEEVFFRLILVKGLQSLLKVDKTFSKPNLAIVFGAAFVFSAVHYVGVYGDHFTVTSFVFRWTFGLIMNFLLVTRGFGITAWSHAIYDILVFTARLG